MIARTHSGPPAASLAVSLAALLVTACGGGGGGEVITDPPTTPASRTVSFSYDYDNNGVADATSTASYDAAGRDTGFAFTYTGDGTTDRYQPLPPRNEVDERSYDGAGNLVRMVFRPAGAAATTMDTSFDGAGLPLVSDLSTVPAGAIMRITYTQAGGRLTGATTTLNGVLVAEERLEFGADGRPSLRETTRNPAFGGPPTARTEYLWRADGQLERVRVDDDGNGAFETTLTLNYVADVHVSTVQTGVANLTITAFRDGLGRVIRTEHDDGSDGSIDAVITSTWQNGACIAVRMPGLPPFVEARSGGFRATPNGDVDVGCGPVQP
jgi:hypothetical protein